jgi:undecaprenyl-diphosphatase
MERVLARVAHWTTHFRYRDYVPVVIVLAAGLTVTLIAGDAFEDLADLVRSDSPALHRIDTDVHHWARYTRTQGSTLFFTTMTLIGTPLPLAIIVLAVAAYHIARGHRGRPTYLLITCGVGALLNLGLKSYFERARPDLAEALRHASGYSFPSGHAMGSTIVFLALAYVAIRTFPKWRWRAASLALAVSMILSIASSRIYLGVHWISDVAAGITAGLVWVVTTTIAYETFRRIRLIRSLREKRATVQSLKS